MMWDYKKWPIKPEIVLEGGNVAYSEKERFYTEADDLSLLTTGHQYLFITAVRQSPHSCISLNVVLPAEITISL